MIIGISGKAGSGKDTAAKMLEVLYANPDISYEDFVNRRYKNFVDIEVVHFADILKETVQALFAIGEWETNTQEGKKVTISWIGKTVRELLQEVGQGLRDAIDPDVWVKALFANTEDWANIIIADVRYPNELEAIKERDGVLIRIDRNGAGAGNHSSETALDDYNDWDFHIGNNGSMEDLFEAMRIFTKNYPID
jgi:dephospho-CoA kinase